MLTAILLTALVVLTLAVVGTITLFRQHLRRWSHWRRGPDIVPQPEQYAVVLAHGFLGFDTKVGKRVHYFRGVTKELARHGAKVAAARLGSMESVPQRAEHLRAFVESLGEERVVLIAHSMGGLDARFALSTLGMHERVKALITVGSPHRGTPLTALAETLPSIAARRFFELLGIDSSGFDWLSERACARLNETLEDRTEVFYGSVVGAPKRRHFVDMPALLTSYEVLKRLRGPNDGVVPVSSQHYGMVLKRVPAHHFAQMGWSPTFNAAALYAELLIQLSERGFPCLPTALPPSKIRRAS